MAEASVGQLGPTERPVAISAAGRFWFTWRLVATSLRRLRSELRRSDDRIELSQIARRSLGPGGTGEDHGLAFDLEDMHDSASTGVNA